MIIETIEERISAGQLLRADEAIYMEIIAGPVLGRNRTAAEDVISQDLNSRGLLIKGVHPTEPGKKRDAFTPLGHIVLAAYRAAQ